MSEEVLVEHRHNTADRRELEELRRQLQNQQFETYKAEVAAALARVNEKQTEVTMRAELAAKNAERALNSVESHERECVIRNDAVKSALDKLDGVPQALVSLAERLSANSADRQEHHAAQQKALKALSDKVDQTIGGGKNYAIALLWSALAAMGGVIGYLMATYVLPKVP